MRRRILTAIIGIAILSTIVLTVPLAIIGAHRARDDAFRELDRAAERASASVSADLGRSNDPVDLPVFESNISVAVFDEAGRRVAGRGPESPDSVTAKAISVTERGVVGGDHVVARPIIFDEQRIGVIRSAEPVSETTSRIQRDLFLLVAIDLGAILVAVMVGWVLSARLVRPLQSIRDDAVRLGNGDFSVQPSTSGVAELDDTSAALAETAHRLEAAMMRERAFSANASHQLRTPLTAMRLVIESEVMIPRADPLAVHRESLAELDRLESTIDTLLSVARDRPLRRGLIDVATLSDQILSRWNGVLAASGRPFHLLAPAHLDAHASTDVLHQILDVLISNADVHGAGEVTVAISGVASSVVLTVTDEGAIDRHVSDLFVHRDPGAEGHGVGLAVARALAEAEGGRLTLACASPTTFRTVLPDLR